MNVKKKNLEYCSTFTCTVPSPPTIISVGGNVVCGSIGVAKMNDWTTFFNGSSKLLVYKTENLSYKQKLGMWVTKFLIVCSSFFLIKYE